MEGKTIGNQLVGGQVSLSSHSELPCPFSVKDKTKHKITRTQHTTHNIDRNRLIYITIHNALLRTLMFTNNNNFDNRGRTTEIVQVIRVWHGF